MLRACKYEALGVTQPNDALEILRRKKGEFHLVLTDIHMPGMSGFELLDIVQKQFKIPVIMISADNTIEAMTKAVGCGACSYIMKPVNKSSIQNVGQFVFREFSSSNRCSKINASMGENEADRIPDKKPRMVWKDNVQEIFLAAVEFLGEKKAKPSSILEIMNSNRVTGVTARHISSHLQKYRLSLKKKKASQSQARERYGQRNPSFNQNSIPQHWQSNACASNLNQRGLSNYLEHQLWKEGTTGVVHTELSFSENRHLGAFDHGSTQVGDSSHLYTNLNPVSNMLQVTPEAPLMEGLQYQNQVQELNLHGLNNYPEPHQWNEEEMTPVEQAQFNFNDSGSLDALSYGNPQVGNSFNLFMNSNALLNMPQVLPQAPHMTEPYYQNLIQGPNNFAEPQVWSNKGMIGVEQTHFNFNETGPLDAFDNGSTEVGVSSNLSANPNPTPVLVAQPYQNICQELDRFSQYGN